MQEVAKCDAAVDEKSENIAENSLSEQKELSVVRQQSVEVLTQDTAHQQHSHNNPTAKRPKTKQTSFKVTIDRVKKQKAYVHFKKLIEKNQVKSPYLQALQKQTNKQNPSKTRLHNIHACYHYCFYVLNRQFSRSQDQQNNTSEIFYDEAELKLLEELQSYSSEVATSLVKSDREQKIIISSDDHKNQLTAKHGTTDVKEKETILQTEEDEIDALLHELDELGLSSSTHELSTFDGKRPKTRKGRLPDTKIGQGELKNLRTQEGQSDMTALKQTQAMETHFKVKTDRNKKKQNCMIV